MQTRRREEITAEPGSGCLHRSTFSNFSRGVALIIGA
jgi:hypothetical protein